MTKVRRECDVVGCNVPSVLDTSARVTFSRGEQTMHVAAFFCEYHTENPSMNLSIPISDMGDDWECSVEA